MSRRKRRTFSPEFKAKVVKEALKERETLAQLASKFELSVPQISTWKKQAIEAMPALFSQARKADKEDQETLVAKLYEEIGRLKMEQDWLKKKLGD